MDAATGDRSLSLKLEEEVDPQEYEAGYQAYLLWYVSDGLRLEYRLRGRGDLLASKFYSCRIDGTTVAVVDGVNRREFCLCNSFEGGTAEETRAEQIVEALNFHQPLIFALNTLVSDLAETEDLIHPETGRPYQVVLPVRALRAALLKPKILSEGQFLLPENNQEPVIAGYAGMTREELAQVQGEFIVRSAVFDVNSVQPSHIYTTLLAAIELCGIQTAEGNQQVLYVYQKVNGSGPPAVQWKAIWKTNEQEGA